MEDQAQISVMPVTSNDTNNLLAEVDGIGDGESAPTLPITNSANQPILKAVTQFFTKADIQPVIETEQPETISAKK